MEYSNLRRIYTSKTVEYQVRILEIFTFLFLLPSSQFDSYGNSARMEQAMADVAKRDSLGLDVNDSHTQKSCQWKWRYWQDERSKPGLWLQFRQTFLTEGEYMWRLEKCKDFHALLANQGFPGGSDGERICLQCKRPRFNNWVGKIPQRREWLPTPIFFPGEFNGQRSLVGYNP